MYVCMTLHLHRFFRNHLIKTVRIIFVTLIEINAIRKMYEYKQSKMLMNVTKMVVIVLVFYCPSTLFRSFWVRSVNLSIMFLGKPPKQFTST